MERGQASFLELTLEVGQTADVGWLNDNGMTYHLPKMNECGNIVPMSVLVSNNDNAIACHLPRIVEC